MSTTGTTEQPSDAWIEVQFAKPSDPAVQSGHRQAMEKLLIDAQRESGQSSLAVSGSASPAIAGSHSPPIAAPAGGVVGTDRGGAINLPGIGEWQYEWPARSQPGWQKCQTWRFLSLRKTALMRWPSSLLLGLLSHAASFLLGAASMYIVIRSVSSQRQQQDTSGGVIAMSRY